MKKSGIVVLTVPWRSCAELMSGIRDLVSNLEGLAWIFSLPVVSDYL